MPERIERDVLVELAGVGDRAKVSPGDIWKAERPSDLIGKDQVVIEPRAFHCKAMLVLLASVADHACPHIFADRYLPAALGGFGLGKIISAAFAVILDDLLDADLMAVEVTPTQGKIFLGPHARLEGEFKDHAVRHRAAKLDEPARLPVIQNVDLGSRSLRAIGMFAGIRFDIAAADAPGKESIERSVQVADRRRGP